MPSLSHRGTTWTPSTSWLCFHTTVHWPAHSTDSWLRHYPQWGERSIFTATHDKVLVWLWANNEHVRQHVPRVLLMNLCGLLVLGPSTDALLDEVWMPEDFRATREAIMKKKQSLVSHVCQRWLPLRTSLRSHFDPKSPFFCHCSLVDCE